VQQNVAIVSERQETAPIRMDRGGGVA
jgi:hypothetical protein